VNDRRSLAPSTFTAEFEEYAAPNTQKKYKLLLKKLTAFAETKGYVLLEQLAPVDIREFRSSWLVSPQTAAKNMSIVKAFFEFCVSNEWLQRNPARLVKNQRSRGSADRRNEQKLPFSDEELRHMYEACETRYDKQEIKWSRVTHHHRASGEYVRYNIKWTGQDLADFISISVYTGLRISDVATFHIDRMQSAGEIRIRTTKAGTHVYTWVPEWLQERIRSRAHEVGPHIFGEHTTTDMNVVTDVWRRKLNKLWSLCGTWKDKPTPNPVSSHLRPHPAPTPRRDGVMWVNWSETRNKWLENTMRPGFRNGKSASWPSLKAAFSEKPKPNVIQMPKAK